MADAPHSKCGGGDPVRVRIPLPAPSDSVVAMFRNQPHMRRASVRSERTAKELAALAAWRRSAVVLFAASVLLGIIVVATAIGSRRAPTETTQNVAQAVITPQSLPTVPADGRATPDATVTPTPRVVVAEPTPTLRPRAAATPRVRRTPPAPSGIAVELATPPRQASRPGRCRLLPCLWGQPSRRMRPPRRAPLESSPRQAGRTPIVREMPSTLAAPGWRSMAI